MIAQQFLNNLLDDDDNEDFIGHNIVQNHQMIAAPNERAPLNYLFLDDEQFRARFRGQKFVTSNGLIGFILLFFY